MSLKGRFRNLAAAFLMVLSTVAPMGGALTRSVYAAEGDPDLGTPEHSKTLTPNGDGTYTITLSVTGKAESTTVNNGANVVVVLDTSGSMRYFLDSDTGRYGTNNSERPASINDYYETNVTLYSERTWSNRYNRYVCSNEITDNTTSGPVYYNNGNRCDEYTGQRYDSSSTRLESAKSSLNSLFTTLLNNNSTEHPSLVEISLISFDDTATLRNSWTTSKTTLSNTLNNSNLIRANGATNWDDALRLAKSTLDGKNDGDKGYVIFMTDGNPTYYHNCQGRTGCTGSATDANTVSTSYNQAAPQALAITNAGYNLYNLGVYGSVDRMQNLTTHANTATAENHGDAYYYVASNETAVNAAFADIANSITNNLSLTNIKYSDGITGMTTMAVNGTAGNFQYTLGGTATTDPRITTAKYENGEVIWDMGNYVLENGVTATVSFTVWPSQEAYDLVADLNNGKKAYSSLTEEEKKSVSCTLNDAGAVVSCGLKTNTDYPELQYRTVKNSTDGSDPVYGKLQKVSLTNPKPVDLVSKKLDVVKLWEDELDPDQQEDYCNKDTKECSVVLKLMRGSEVYEDNIVVKKNGNEWKADKQIAIAPGIMISADSKTGKIVNTGQYPVVDGYVILEEGHDYELQEYDITDHYYLTHYQYHPMLVDGVVKNVIFEYSGNKIVSIIEMNDLSQISATNTLKGGFEVTKTVSGKADTKDQKFTIKTLFDDNVAHTYRIYYGENNPCYESTEAGCVDEKGNAGRSVKTTVAGTVTLDIYAGDTIRFQDIDTGTKFKVEEVTDGLPLGYSLDEIEYTVKHGDGEYGAYDQDKIDGNWYIVQPNASARATVKNVYDATTLKISKNVEVLHGDEDAIKSKSFTFKVTLKNGNETLGGEFEYVTNKNKTGKIKSGDTISLVDGETATIKDLPVGAGYEVEELEANKSGFTTTVAGQESSDALAKSGAEIVYTNTYDASPVSTQIKALKDFNDWTANDAFTFTLTDKGGNMIGSVDVTEKTKQAVFDVQYTNPGTYEYTITESTEGFAARGITSTPNSLNVKVVVVDNGDGTLSIGEQYPEVSGNATITNTYASVGSMEFSATKILSGRDWQAGDSFTFRLYEVVDGQEIEKESLTLDSEKQSADFETKISYSTSDRDKTFVYIIREDESNIAGVKNKTGDLRIEVTLTDDHQGNLTTNFDDDKYTAVITNEYTAKPVDVTLNVEKTIDDQSLSNKEGTFTFELRDEDGNLVGSKNIQTSDEGEVSFNPISFDKAGTYNYTITEVAGNEAGFTYDKTVHQVKIVVSDKYDGTAQLSAVVTIDGEVTNIAAFENIYKATNTTYQLEITKELEGIADNLAGEFEFMITSDNDAKESVEIKGAGTAKSQVYTYEQAGLYQYMISEVDSKLPGYTYDDSVYMVMVIVEDVDGQLKVSKVEVHKNYTGNVVEGIVFKNSYAAEGKTTLQIQKEFDGADYDWDDKTFSFELTGDGLDNAMIVEASKDNGWKATFENIEYTEVGTYHYQIQELNSGLAGVMMSDPVYVVVEVTDNGDGTLTATPSYENGNVITNTYATNSTTAQLHVEKKIDDKSGSKVDGTFEFTLNGKVGDETYSDSQSVTTHNLTGGADFKEINFEEAGTYEFTLKEVKGDVAGFSYDEKEYAVKIVVKDNPEKAQLYIDSITIDGEDKTELKSFTITNTYEADATSYEISVRKNLNGLGEGLEPVSFKFDLSGDAKDSVTINGAGTATFKKIDYTKVGTYHYVVTENSTDKQSGYSYDATSYDITVEVADVDGKLVATPTIVKNGESTTDIEFTNVYHSEGSVDIYVTKKLEGRDWLKDDKFTFELSGDGVESQKQTVDTENRIAKFTLSYDESDHNKSYSYTISEVGTLPAGMEKPEDLTVTVSVKDNGDGTLTITPDKEGGEYEITNSYTAKPVSVDLHVDKTIDDQSNSNIDGDFTFELSGDDYSDSVVVSTEKQTGSADFKPIEYTEVGTYKYTLTEKNDGKAGFDYDDTKYEVVVEVTDDYENAQLKATVKINGTETNKASFTNTYKAEATKVQFELSKVLEGMNEGVDPAEFEFEMTGDAEEVVKVKGSGTAIFKEIKYDKVGTYEYKIVEKNTGAAGYTYDLAVFIVKVTVTDEGGKLVADIQIERDGEAAESIEFKNTYEAEPIIDYSFFINKVLEGRELVEGEFSFTLYDEDGNVVATTTNEEAGYATFTGLNFYKPGTYVFTVKEDIDEERGDIEFDTNEYTITVVVYDDGEGSLMIESDDSSDVTFTNIYHEPGKGEDLPNPNTQDDIVNNIALMSMSVIGLIGAIIFGKRKANEDEQ